MVKNWAFLFLSPGYNPEKHTVIMDNGQTKFTAIGMDMQERELAIDIAKKLVAEGVEMIELCGGFGPLYIAKIKEATQHKIPVGSTMYGPEDREAMLKIVRNEK